MAMSTNNYDGMPTASRFIMGMLGLTAVLGVFGGLTGSLSTGDAGRNTFVASHLIVGLVVAVCWWGSRSTAVRADLWATIAFIAAILASIVRNSFDPFYGILLACALTGFGYELKLWYGGDLRRLLRDMTRRAVGAGDGDGAADRGGR